MSGPASAQPERITHWVISEVYYPEETSTGHYMTLIAEGLARHVPVGVICARPNYSRRGAGVPSREVRNGVEITRAWSSTFDKNKVPLRLINIATVGLSMFFKACWNIRRGDRVLVGTNPPTLPFLVAFACWLRGARCFLKVEDVCPDNMVVAGLIARHGVAARFLDAAHRALYRKMDVVCVLGRDMARCIAQKAAPAAPRITWIPNWADSDSIEMLPRESNPLIAAHNLGGKFVVGYAGNIGPLQNISFVFEAMKALQADERVHFMFVGSGKMADWLQASCRQAGLKNVTFVGPRPRSEQSVFLGACDVGLVCLSPGMSGLGVPSRSYNLMAAGRPILASVDSDSEIALMVQEERIGWVVRPGDVGGFVATVRDASGQPAVLREMGARARRMAEGKYSPPVVIDQYRAVLL